jgi:hypothetical protein
MKEFSLKDTTAHGAVANARTLNVNYPQDLVSAPLWFHRRGLQQTASGYGAKLTSSFKINYEKKLRRIYHTCYGNASSAWIKVKGIKIFIN